MLQTLPGAFEFGDDFEHGTGVGLGQRIGDPAQSIERKATQQLADFGSPNLAAAGGNGLIERRERIAHAAFARLGDHGQRFVVGFDAFEHTDLAHALHQLFKIHRAKGELLAAGSDGYRNLVRLRGTHQKDHPLGRLL